MYSEKKKTLYTEKIFDHGSAISAEKNSNNHENERDLLQATLDSSVEMIQVFKAVRNECGEIIDFIWLLNNARSEQFFGDVIGKSLLTCNPGVIKEGIFKNFVEVVNTGVPQQYEKYYVYEQFNGWFHQSVVKLNDGVATSTLDITEKKVAEQQLAKLEADQKLEIFKATFASQEEERKRISENLHNGLGQLLYGIKISLATLNKDIALAEPEVYLVNKRYTEDLLSQAIHESRRISHELTPGMLEHKGLKMALQDVCRQFSSAIRFSCFINMTAQHLERYLELAVFRMTQELMVNVIKHARSTEAHVNIEAKVDKVTIVVTDNGIGFDTAAALEKGIGLMSIHSKIKLLNGSVTMRSSTGNTEIILQIPIQS